MAVTITNKFYASAAVGWRDISKIVFTSPNLNSPANAGTRSHILPGQADLGLWYEDTSNMYRISPVQDAMPSPTEQPLYMGIVDMYTGHTFNFATDNSILLDTSSLANVSLAAGDKIYHNKDNYFTVLNLQAATSGVEYHPPKTITVYDTEWVGGEYYSTNFGDFNDWSITGTAAIDIFNGMDVVIITGSTGLVSGSIISRNIGSIGRNKFYVEFKSYFTTTIGADSVVEFSIESADCKLQMRLTPSGASVFDGYLWRAVTGVTSLFSSIWYTWILVVDFTTPSLATVDVYLNSDLKEASKDCSYTGSFTDGLLKFTAIRHSTSLATVVYLDYLKIGNSSSILGYRTNIPYNVYWEATGIYTNDTVKIDYSVDGGSVWLPIASGVVNDGSSTFSIPTVSSAAKLKITSESSPSTFDESNMFRTTLGELNILRPQLLSDLKSRKTHKIWWNSANFYQGELIDIDISFNNGSDWEELARDLPNTGYAIVDFPNKISQETKIKIYATLAPSDMHATSDVFVTTSGVTTVLALNSSVAWRNRHEHRVYWNTYNIHNEEDVNVYISYDGGGWELLVSGTPNVGYATVLLPEDVSDAARIKVESDIDSGINGVSSVFNTTAGGFDILTPTAYESWDNRRYHNIWWNSESFYNTEYVDIDLSVDGGSSWYPLATNVLNAGVHSAYFPVYKSGENSFIKVKSSNDPDYAYETKHITVVSGSSISMLYPVSSSDVLGNGTHQTIWWNSTKLYGNDVLRSYGIDIYYVNMFNNTGDLNGWNTIVAAGGSISIDSSKLRLYGSGTPATSSIRAYLHTLQGGVDTSSATKVRISFNISTSAASLQLTLEYTHGTRKLHITFDSGGIWYQTGGVKTLLYNYVPTTACNVSFVLATNSTFTFYIDGVLIRENVSFTNAVTSEYGLVYITHRNTVAGTPITTYIDSLIILDGNVVNYEEAYNNQGYIGNLVYNYQSVDKGVIALVTSDSLSLSNYIECRASVWNTSGYIRTIYTTDGPKAEWVVSGHTFYFNNNPSCDDYIIEFRFSEAVELDRISLLLDSYYSTCRLDYAHIYFTNNEDGTHRRNPLFVTGEYGNYTLNLSGFSSSLYLNFNLTGSYKYYRLSLSGIGNASPGTTPANSTNTRYGVIRIYGVHIFGSSGTDGVDVLLSTNGGSEWVTLVSGTPNKGSAEVYLEYDVVDIGNSLLKVRSSSDPLYLSDTKSLAISSGTLGVVYPSNTNISVIKGEPFYAWWNSEYIYDDSTVSLSLTTDAGFSYETTYSGVINEGTLNWVLPMSLSSGTENKIKISKADGTQGVEDESDNYFTIEEPQINIIGPTSGTVFRLYDSSAYWFVPVDTTDPEGPQTGGLGYDPVLYKVWWDTNIRNNKEVSLYFSIDGGGSWTTISSGIENTGNHAILLDIIEKDTISDNCLVRVEHTNTYGTTVTGTSEVFKIEYPNEQLQTFTPIGGTWTSTFFYNNYFYKIGIDNKIYRTNGYSGLYEHVVDFTEAVMSNPVMVLKRGNIYIINPQNNAFYEYVHTTGFWRTLTPAPDSSYVLESFSDDDGYVYTVGKTTGSIYRFDVTVYGGWSVIGSCLRNYTSGDKPILYKAGLTVVSGTGGEVILSTVYDADPTKKTFNVVPLGSLPSTENLLVKNKDVTSLIVNGGLFCEIEAVASGTGNMLFVTGGYSFTDTGVTKFASLKDTVYNLVVASGTNAVTLVDPAGLICIEGYRSFHADYVSEYVDPYNALKVYSVLPNYLNGTYNVDIEYNDYTSTVFSFVDSYELSAEFAIVAGTAFNNSDCSLLSKNHTTDNAIYGSFIIGDDIYVAGGENNNVPFFKYDLLTNTWSMPSNNYFTGTISGTYDYSSLDNLYVNRRFDLMDTDGTNVYKFAGYDLNKFYSYNLNTDVVVELSDPPVLISEQPSMVYNYNSNRIYLIHDKDAVNNLWIYDVTTNIWGNTSDSPIVIDKSLMTSWGDYVYILEGKYLKHRFLRYDVIADEWLRLADRLYETSYNTTGAFARNFELFDVCANSNYVYAIGGHSDSTHSGGYTPKNTELYVYEYSIVANSWRRLLKRVDIIKDRSILEYDYENYMFDKIKCVCDENYLYILYNDVNDSEELEIYKVKLHQIDYDTALEPSGWEVPPEDSMPYTAPAGWVAPPKKQVAPPAGWAAPTPWDLTMEPQPVGFVAPVSYPGVENAPGGWLSNSAYFTTQPGSWRAPTASGSQQPTPTHLSNIASGPQIVQVPYATNLSLVNVVGTEEITKGDGLYVWGAGVSRIGGTWADAHNSILFEITIGECYNCRLTAWDDITHSTTLNELLSTDRCRTYAVAFSSTEPASYLGAALDPVIDIRSAPPSFVSGNRYLIGTNPTGAWVGSAHSIATSTTNSWTYTTLNLHDRVYVTAESCFYYRTSTGVTKRNFNLYEYVHNPSYGVTLKGNVSYYGDFSLKYRYQENVFGDYLMFKPYLYNVDGTISYGVHDFYITLHYSYT